MSFKPKLWLGIGAFTLAGAAQSAPADLALQVRPALAAGPSLDSPGLSDRSAPAAGFMPVAQAQGGEGGEGGEGGAFADAAPDVTRIGQLRLVRGHLEVARALARKGEAAEAAAQALHPIAEEGAVLDPALESAIRAYSDALESVKTDAEREAAYGAVIAGLDAAEAAVPATERDDPAFRLKVGLRLLRQAGVEYGEAAEDNFASPQEYRHARGFLLAAQDWLAPVRDRLAASEPETARAVEDALDTLARALPSWDPPQRPIRDPGEVSGAISRLEFAAAALL